MPRVRFWYQSRGLCLSVHPRMFAIVILICTLWISTVQTDCWYANSMFEEGYEVETAEPCLNCTCSRGALLCYLRICAKLPNPPPPGCILLHRFRTCCPELICAEFSGGENGIESRSDPDVGPDITYDRRIMKNACIANGSIYGPGSAMDTSSLCEYCFCLGGNQTCVKPKCLLSIEGCTPIYDKSSCCPVKYNCTALHSSTSVSTTSSTTTEITNTPETKGGCLVDGIYHPEGKKVLGVGHSVCDNCYCLKGLLRCEPLSCAPPLLGCNPVIKNGECCATSYNCSGTIEIQPEPNYGHFPTVSKEYAKFNKQVHLKQPQNQQGIVTVAPFYVLPETSHAFTSKQRSPVTFGTTRHFSGVTYNNSTTKPFYYNTMERNSNNKYSVRNYTNAKESFSSTYQATTHYYVQNITHKRVYTTTTTTKPKPIENLTYKTANSLSTNNFKEKNNKSNEYLDSIQDNIFSFLESLLEDKVNKTVEMENNSTETQATTIVTGDEITNSDSLTSTQISDEDPTTTLAWSTANDFTTEVEPITLKTVMNSTDCIESSNMDITTIISVDANEINSLLDVKEPEYENYSTTTEDFSEASTTETITVDDLKSEAKIVTATLRTIPNLRTEIEAILNITKNKNVDYEYDYNEPSLPPSLPNLRIIPFVAADALDSKKEEVVYPQEKMDTSFGYSNFFSPPTETEGGFVPKDPPVLNQNFYKDSATSSLAKKEDNISANCIDHNGVEIIHGQSVPSKSRCMTCTCFYRNIVCQKPACPIPRPGCRESTMQDLVLCCPHYVCDLEEAPTVVLDIHEKTDESKEVVTIANKVSVPDAFRDVIRTEPPPNLHTLINDMMPHLARKTTTPAQKSSEKTPITTTENLKTTTDTETQQDNDLSLNKVLQFLFSNGNEEKLEITTRKIQKTSTTSTDDKLSAVFTTVAPPINVKPKLTHSSEHSHKVNTSTNSGSALLINLAGCNIYGRMYRVGRIISELSGPCLECKCTEIGVQCNALQC